MFSSHSAIVKSPSNALKTSFPEGNADSSIPPFTLSKCEGHIAWLNPSYWFLVQGRKLSKRNRVVLNVLLISLDYKWYTGQVKYNAVSHTMIILRFRKVYNYGFTWSCVRKVGLENKEISPFYPKELSLSARRHCCNIINTDISEHYMIILSSISHPNRTCAIRKILEFTK